LKEERERERDDKKDTGVIDFVVDGELWREGSG